MTDPAVESKLREFLITEVFYDRELEDLGAEESLIERGLLDSLSILRIVTFCEESFGISIPDTEVLPDHFDSIQAIGKLVERQRAKR